MEINYLVHENKLSGNDNELSSSHNELSCNDTTHMK